MANRLQKTPLAVYTPAVRAVAARPAYCVTHRVYSTPSPGLALSGGSSGSNYTQEALLNQAIAAGYDGVGITYSVLSPSRPRYTTKQTCYPAVAGKDAVPAKIDYSSGTGWNAAARSVKAVPRNGFFRCVVGSTPIATMVGLTRAAMQVAYAGMPIAVVVRPTGYTIVEFGITKVAEAPYPTGALLEFRRLASGRVRVVVDEVEVYTSESVMAGDDVYAGSMLYSLQDAVDSPVIGAAVAPAQLQVELPALRALITDTPVTLFSGELPRLQFSALLREDTGRIQFSAELPPIRALMADRPLVMLDATLPALSFAATLSAPEAMVNGLSVPLPSIRLESLLLSGGTCTIDAALPAVASLISDRELGLVRVTMPIRLAMTVGEPYLEPGFIDALDVVVAADRATLDTVLVLVALDSLDVSGSAELTFVLELSALDSLGLSDSVTFGQLVELLAIERVAITSDAAAAQRQALQYAVNALTGAPTTYDGFDFLSFATVDGVTYGVRADGLYQIGDSIGADELISALVDFGTSDFSDAHVKRMETAYLGLRTDGQAFLRVRADVGTERAYRVLGQNNVRRSSLGKGIAGRSWTLKLELVDASFAEVDSLELAVGATQRRGFGSRTR